MKLLFMDALYEIRVVRGTYNSNGNMFIGIEDLDEDGVWEDFCDVTINFDIDCPEGCGFINVPDIPNEVYDFLLPYIEKTGRVIDNGYIKYPEVKFSKELLDIAVQV